MSFETIILSGIVDKVRAVRRSSSDEVLYLEATIHVKMDEDTYHGQYGGAVTTELAIPVPVETSINPGDVAAINIETVNPFGQRFKPALEVGNPADELDEDMLADEAADVDA